MISDTMYIIKMIMINLYFIAVETCRVKGGRLNPLLESSDPDGFPELAGRKASQVGPDSKKIYLSISRCNKIRKLGTCSKPKVGEIHHKDLQLPYHVKNLLTDNHRTMIIK